MVPDDVYLLKLVWHPDSLNGSEVQPSAFRGEDLDGLNDHHVSVDRHDMAVRSTMERVAELQASKANGEDIIRTEPFIGRLSCRSVRDVVYNETLVAFKVEEKPIAGNDAHCGICNATQPLVKSRSYLDFAKSALALLASPAVTFQEAYSTEKAEDGAKTETSDETTSDSPTD